MKKFLTKGILQMIPVLLAVSVLIFAMIRMTATYNTAAVNELIAKQAAESDPIVRNDILFEAMDIAVGMCPTSSYSTP